MDFGASGQFPATAWSVVWTAKDRHSPEGLEALNCCIAGYWKPVFYFVRAKDYPLHQAEDLTQEFFSRFFERDWIRRADPSRGRFRTLYGYMSFFGAACMEVMRWQRSRWR